MTVSADQSYREAILPTHYMKADTNFFPRARATAPPFRVFNPLRIQYACASTKDVGTHVETTPAERRQACLFREELRQENYGQL